MHRAAQMSERYATFSEYSCPLALWEMSTLSYRKRRDQSFGHAGKEFWAHRKKGGLGLEVPDYADSLDRQQGLSRAGGIFKEWSLGLALLPWHTDSTFCV